MGNQQILLLVLSVIIIGGSISIGIMMFMMQRDAFETRIVDNTLMQMGLDIYAICIQPISMGGFGGNVRTMQNNQDRVRQFIPEIEASILAKLKVNKRYKNGVRLLFFRRRSGIAVGVKFKENNIERWVQINCATGDVRVNNSRPRAKDFVQ